MEFLKKDKKLLEKSAAKSSEKISEIWKMSKIWKLREKWVNGLGFFAYFQQICGHLREKKKIEKLYRSDAISEEKEGEICKNLEKMSKWTGLNC